MTRTIWLASYPKSGNTWLRVLLANAMAKNGEGVDINKLFLGGIASARGVFDYFLLIESGLLTHDEIDNLRPVAYSAMARDAWEDGLTKPEAPPVRFVKVHDAHTINSAGKPVLGGSAGAHGAIVIVRDPRDVAPSLAHQYDLSIDEAIAFMHDEDRALSNTKSAQDSQFRQKLRGWSGHVTSCLDQKDIPIHLIRYEELRQDTPGTLSRALAFAGVSVPVETINRAVAASDFEVLRELEQQKGFVEAPRRGTTFFRRGEVGAWRDELTRDQVMRLEARHWQTMLRLGYRLSHSNLARAG